MRKLAFIIYFLVFFTVSCNYNYHLGLQYEKDTRYEESYEELRKALLRSPTNSKYLAASNRVGIVLVQDMYERYQEALSANNYSAAHFLLERGLSIDPSNRDFLNESPNWYKVLMVGQVMIDLSQLNFNTWLENMKLTVEFNQPDQENNLTSTINSNNGFFTKLVYIYKPTFSFISLYSIKRIGINYVSYLERFSNPIAAEGDKKASLSLPELTTDSFQPIIDFSTSRINQANGEINWENFTSSGDIKSALPSIVDDTWYSPSDLDYSLSLNKDQVTINGPLSVAPFLPATVYINKKNQSFLIDFGKLEVKKVASSEGWSIQRTRDESLLRFNLLANNLVFKPYSIYDGGYLTYSTN